MSTSTEAPERAEHDDQVDVDQAALDAARDRLQNRDQEQLTFNVGLPGNRPDFASVKLAGSLPVEEDLRRRQEVVVRVMTRGGDLLASAVGTVTSIAFKDKTDDHGTTTERIHTISL